MDLYLRKVGHPQAHENYRVILKNEDGDFDIGSIGIQHAAAASASRSRTRSGCPRRRQSGPRPCLSRGSVQDRF